MMFYATGFDFLKPNAETNAPVMTMTVTKDNKHISPLAKRLFTIYGVDEVTIGQKFVTVTRQIAPDVEADAAESEDVRSRISLTNTTSIKEGKGYSATSTNPVPTASGVQVKTHQLPEEELNKAWEPPHWFDLQFSVCASLADHAHSREPAVELDAPHPHCDTLPVEGDTEVVLSIKELIATVIRPEIQQDGGDIRFLTFTPEDGLMSVELLGACKTCKSSSTTLKDLIERTTRHWIPEVLGVVDASKGRRQQEPASPT